MPRMDKILLRPSEVAEAVGVGRSKVYELIASGAIPSVRLGGCVRVPVASLERWITEQVVSVQAQRPGEN